MGQVGESRLWYDALAPRTDDAREWEVYMTLLQTKWDDVPCFGPLDSWPVSLQTLTSLVLSNTFPAALFWGDDFNMLYNAAYARDIALEKHPEIMGEPYRIGWHEVWDNSESIKSELRTAFETGVATHQTFVLYFVSRGRGLVEEAYFSYTLAPIVIEDGKIGGLYISVIDTTATVINERQNKLVRELGEVTTAASSREIFFQGIRNIFDAYHFDTPLFSVYVPDNWHEDPSSASAREVVYISQAAIGLHPAGEVAIPVSLNRRASEPSDMDTWSQLIRQAVYTRSAVSASKQLRIDVCKRRTFDETCSEVRVIPFYMPADAEYPFIIIVVGVNSRHPFTEVVASFHGVVSHLIVLGLAEIKRGEEAAALEVAQQKFLEAELAKRTEEVSQSELRFTKMASVSPSGIFQADRSGKLLFVNEAWHKLTGIPLDCDPNAWALRLHPDDLQETQEFWAKVLQSTEKSIIVCRWIDNDTIRPVSITVVHHDNLIYGALTDITEQIKAREAQKIRADEAEENKRHQESFLDFTSHELRNPLSAIVGSCDFLIAQATKNRQLLLSLVQDLPKGKADAAKALVNDLGSQDDLETIIQCTMHMKNVIGDVLLISKIDGDHMQLNLSACQPLEQVKAVTNMFHREMEIKAIKCSLQTDPSWSSADIAWGTIDAGRFKQILINLLNNAIKFSQHSPRKEILVTVSGSQLESNARQKTMFVSIQDYGCGMTETEQSRLFAKFSQGSPRTAVRYGGSGLGLHICRRLAHLMGGEITCESTAGEGSTFRFSLQFEAAHAEDWQEIAPSEADHHVPDNFSADDIPSSIVEDKSGQRTTSITLDTLKATMSEKVNVAEKVNLTTLLIVEDNLVNQKILVKQLRSTGRYNLLVANHGLEALTILEKAQTDGILIDACLCDIEMPICDGIECVKRVRDMEKAGTFSTRLPFIACSANARPAQIVSMLDAGMDTTLSKPFRLLQVEEKIREVLMKRP